MRMSELAAQREEEARAMGWDDFLAFEEEERRRNEQQYMNDEQDESGSTQH